MRGCPSRLKNAQHRVGVGGDADGRAWVRAHPLLVDEDRGRQSLEHVDIRPGERRHEALHEGAVGLVDQPLRFRAIVPVPASSCEPETPVNTVSQRLGNSMAVRNSFCARSGTDRSLAVGNLQRGRPQGLRRCHGRQRTAFFTSAVIRFSSAAVLLERPGGRPHGAIVEVRRFLEAERRVPRLELLGALEEADDLVVLGVCGHAVPIFGARAGAAAVMIAWSRFAMALSVPFISATFSRGAVSPSALAASAFSSLARSFIAARSSAENPLDFLLLVAVVLFADFFCVAFFALITPSYASSSMGGGGDVHWQIVCSTNNCRRGVIVQ